MATEELENLLSNRWHEATEKDMSSLEKCDRKTVDKFKSRSEVQDAILASKVPPGFASIHTALDNLSAFIDFFAQRLAVILDMHFLWGSIACLLQLVLNDPRRRRNLNRIPQMIVDLTNRAEMFKRYCNAIPIDKTVKSAYIDMQILCLDFFTACIKHIREEPWGSGVIASTMIEKQYKATCEDLSAYINSIEKLQGISGSNGAEYPPNTHPVPGYSKSRCRMLPPTEVIELFDRTDMFQMLDSLLKPEDGSTSFKSVALHGMGGVGKTSIASSYIKREFENYVYDVVLWARGEKTPSLRQSFTDIAMRLKLDGAQYQLHDENLARVHNWFQFTDCKWLIVYDNVESYDIIERYWPRTNRGKAIITTRNHSLVLKPASYGLEVTSWDDQIGSEFLLFLLKGKIGRDLESENNSALTLSHRFGGHALILSNVAGRIFSGENSITEFMTMYLKNPHHTHAEPEISERWGFSSLDSQSQALLGVLSFLMPDTIPQQLFEADDKEAFPGSLQFCADFYVFSNALTKLLTLALVKKDRDTRILSIHRMIQAQYKQFLTLGERQKHFSNAVALLYRVFPPYDSTRAQLYDVWETCNQYVQHIISLKDCFLEEIKVSKTFKVPWKFCELLAQCQRYLYESNLIVEFESVCDANLIALGTIEDDAIKEDLYITTLTHKAQAAETLGDVNTAIDLNKDAFHRRLLERPKKELLLCYTANNLGYCYNTANKHALSLGWYNVSEDLWHSLAKDGQVSSDRPARHLKNKAICLLYLGKIEEAKRLFGVSLERLRTETPLNWAMLAYGYFGLATLERRQKDFESAEAHYIEAQNSWLKGDQTRLHPFNGACMYKIGACCLDQLKVEAAIKHIRDSMEVTKFHSSSMPIEHARNLFKLSEALPKDIHAGSSTEADSLRSEAEAILKTRIPDAVGCGTESSYDDLIPIFWR